MFHVANDTTFNRGNDPSKIQEAVIACYRDYKKEIANQLVPVQTGNVHDNHFIFGFGTGPFSNPKPFTHPIRFMDDEDYVSVFDARTSTRYERSAEKPIINNVNLFRRDLIIAILSEIWITESPKEILQLGHMQVYTFAYWISGIVTRRFGLDPDHQMKLTVLAAYYYICLCYPKDKCPTLQASATILARATNLPASTITLMFEDLDYMDNIVDFCETVKEQLLTERLYGFSPDILATLLSGTWFGPNHVALVATSLEYPPVFAALTYLALTDRANRATGLASIVLKRERDPIASEFLKMTNNLLKEEAGHIDL